MSPHPHVDRYAAFAEQPEFGNPAGVVLHAKHLTAEEMQRIAADVGYSETAFITSDLSRSAPISVRYFAPEGEVDFCGHATIATAVALGRTLGFGEFALDTRVGTVTASARQDGDRMVGAFTSAPVSSAPLPDHSRDALLTHLNWSITDLNPHYAPAVGFGGNKHPILVARDLQRLADLSYDFDALRALSRAEDWVTIQLVAEDGPGRWRSRNPFPWGGVVEDPATGSAAAAFAGYLRAIGRVTPGDKFTIVQGVEMGRTSHLEIEVLEVAARIAGPVAVIPAPSIRRD